MQIKLLGSIALNQSRINSIPISEFSGLAWDTDEQILYAISDEGRLYHLKLGFDSNKLTSMEVVYATPLNDIIGSKLKGKYSDSEGLSIINGNNKIKGDTQLIVSFENKPRVAKYSTKGKLLAKVKIPKKLRKRKSYRHKNKALESVTIHPKYGVITAAEYPLKKNHMKKHTLYATSYSDTKKSAKKVWHFAASHATNSAVTGLETLPDGNILVLERAYQNPITPIIINLRRVYLDNCNKKQHCKVETIANFNGIDGWILDNFEGVTHLRENQYLMVSDDNNNPLQKTILVHFEIINSNQLSQKNNN
ncbi:MAG: esterase-like activity of phytase family protein [Cocleimonas sp.]